MPGRLVAAARAKRGRAPVAVAAPPGRGRAWPCCLAVLGRARRPRSPAMQQEQEQEQQQQQQAAAATCCCRTTHARTPGLQPHAPAAAADAVRSRRCRVRFKALETSPVSVARRGAPRLPVALRPHVWPRPRSPAHRPARRRRGGGSRLAVVAVAVAAGDDA